VDYAGQPCDYDALREITGRHDLALVADACHSLGASYKGRPVGTLADLTVFSLHPVKAMTTGEGGMITTESFDSAYRMRCFRNHGVTSDRCQREKQGSWLYDMVELGHNYRLSDVQCALGLSQLSKVSEFVARRRAIVFVLSDFFDDGYERQLRASAARHDVIALTLADPRESSLPDVGLLELHDAETGARVLVDTSDSAVRAAYTDRARERAAARRRSLAAAGIDEILLETGRSYVEPLLRAFRARERRR